MNSFEIDLMNTNYGKNFFKEKENILNKFLYFDFMIAKIITPKFKITVNMDGSITSEEINEKDGFLIDEDGGLILRFE